MGLETEARLGNGLSGRTLGLRIEYLGSEQPVAASSTGKQPAAIGKRRCCLFRPLAYATNLRRSLHPEIEWHEYPRRVERSP